MSVYRSSVGLLAIVLLLNSVAAQDHPLREPDAKKQVVLNIQFLQVSAPMMERLEKDHFNGKSIVFLNDATALGFMEAIQSDRYNIMQAPKMILANGQAGNWDVTARDNFVTGISFEWDGQLLDFRPVLKNEAIPHGLTLSAKPTAAADNRFVLVDLKVQKQDIEEPVAVTPVQIMPTNESLDATGKSPRGYSTLIQQPKVKTQTIEKMLNIGNGHTALIKGWKERTAKAGKAQPMLGQVPFVNQLAKSEGRPDVEQVLLMVTPRIVGAD